MTGTAAKPADLQRAFFRGLTGFGGERDEWHPVTAEFHLSPMGARSSFTRQQSAARHWNKEHTRGVLVGSEVFAVNVLPPYGTFEDILPLIASLHGRYLRTAKPARVLWLGHRYINQVTLSLRERQSPAEFFTLYPPLRDAGSRHPPVGVQIEAARFEDGIVLANLGLSALNGENAVYTLDLYAKTTSDAPPSTADAITEWHKRAHEEVRAIFLWCITNEARSRFKEIKA